MEPVEIVEAVDTFISIYKLLKEIKSVLEKPRGWKLFSSRKPELIERKFKEALVGTKNAIESCVWFGKGYAIAEKCSPSVIKGFHHLMGLLISQFNDMHLRLDPEKLDEKLVEHLLGQLKTLEKYAHRFYQLDRISTHADPKGDALKILGDFSSKLWDLRNSMERYLKPEK